MSARAPKPLTRRLKRRPPWTRAGAGGIIQGMSYGSVWEHEPKPRADLRSWLLYGTGGLVTLFGVFLVVTMIVFLVLVFTVHGRSEEVARAISDIGISP